MFVSGIVEDVNEREVTTRFGLKKSYTVVMDDGKKYGAGFKHPGVRKGDAVQFEQKGDTYNTIIGTISKTGTAPTGGGTPTGVSTPEVTSKKDHWRPFPIPPLHGDRAIIRQNAMTHAVNIALHALPKGAPPSEVLVQLDFIIQLARKVEAYTAGDLDQAEATATLAAAKATLAEGS